METHRQPIPHDTMRLPAGDPRTEILRLETEIEELTEVIERCRKIILMSKIAVAAGSIWLLALGLIQWLLSKLRPPYKLPKHLEPNRSIRLI
jgi:hypothetical protein